MKQHILTILFISFVFFRASAQEFCVNLNDENLVVDQFAVSVNELKEKLRQLTLENDSMNLITFQDDGVVVEMIFQDKKSGWFGQSKWRTVVKMVVVFSVNSNDSNKNDMRVSVQASEGIIGHKRIKEIKRNREEERLKNYQTNMVKVINQFLRS